MTQHYLPTNKRTSFVRRGTDVFSRINQAELVVSQKEGLFTRKNNTLVPANSASRRSSEAYLCMQVAF